MGRTLRENDKFAKEGCSRPSIYCSLRLWNTQAALHSLPSETSTITPKILLNTRHPFLLVSPGPAILSEILQGNLTV